MSTTLLKPAGNQAYWSQGLRMKYRDHGLKLDANPATPNEPFVDLGYEFNEADFHARSAQILGRSDLQKTLPTEFPGSLSGPLCWSGFQGPVPQESDFVVQLTTQDNAEIKTALKYHLSLQLDGHKANASNFPLPKLGPRLEKIRDDVYNGRGFAVLRGLDVDSYSPEDLMVVTFGITGYVAPIRGKQDQRGSMIMHVISRDEKDAAHNKSVEKPFHTDMSCDVLTLVTRECAAQGGRSILSSGWTVYNEIAATRPDIIHTLIQPNWPFDTLGRSPAYHTRPLLYFHDDKIVWNFSRRLLTGLEHSAPRTKGIPGLTPRQAEALDYVHYTARKHEIYTTMQKGDIRFLNNMGVLHRRESFVDDGNTQRHLLRLWLHNPAYCWKMPRTLKPAWARVFEDFDREEHYDPEPLRALDGKILRTAGSCD